MSATMIAVVFSAPAGAQDFACRNIAAEVRCADGQCALSAPGEFTPMDLRRTGNTLTLCAYSGCWGGRIDHVRTRAKTVTLHAAITQTQSGARDDLYVLYHGATRTAQIRFGEFASPMDCDAAPTP